MKNKRRTAELLTEDLYSLTLELEDRIMSLDLLHETELNEVKTMYKREVKSLLVICMILAGWLIYKTFFIC